MAGIFNLFGESNLDKGQVIKPLARSKTTLGIGGPSVKTVAPLKQKGLSIRSNSNLNVSVTVPPNQEISNKPQEYLKPKRTQLDVGGQPISPGKDFVSEKGYSANISPKKVSDKKNMQLQKSSDETIFKKPSLLENYAKERYPEPETLAPYCDIQFDIYTTAIENEFKELLLKKLNKEEEVIPYEDEGFESGYLDPEQLEYNMSTMCASPFSSDDEWGRCSSPDLPELESDMEL